MASCSTPTTSDLLPPRPEYDKSKTCVRCKEQLGNIVIRHAVYCKSCFLPLVSNKFRRALDPVINDLGQSSKRHKSLRAPGNLLIGLSGGIGSTVLLDLVYKCYFQGRDNGLVNGRENGRTKGGTDHPRNERAWKKAIVCHVDLSEAFPEANPRTHHLRTLVGRYGDVFEFVSLRIEDAFDHDWWPNNDGKIIDGQCLEMDLSTEDILLVPSQRSSLSPAQILRHHLAALPSTSSLPTTLFTLTRLLLQYTAAQYDCSHVVLGTSMTSAGTGLIGNIAGGGTLGEFNTGDLWVSPKKTLVHVSRPLRDVGLKECAFWAWWSNLSVVGKDRIDTDKGRALGINGLTRAFILGLEQDYPSTVSAIVRTCAKVDLKEDEEASQVESCAICQRASQIGSSRLWKKQISITSLSSLEEAELQPNGLHLADYLCYACHTTYTSPGGVGSKAVKRDIRNVPMPVWTEAKFC